MSIVAPHRFEVVTDDEERATDSDGGEEIVDASAVGCARDRRVLGRHEIERPRRVRVEAVGIGVVAVDRQATLVRHGRDAVQGALGDVAGGDVPSMFGEPDGVAAFAGTDVEHPTRLEASRSR